MAEKTTLLPCPFCGGEAELYCTIPTHDSFWYCVCRDCGGSTRYGSEAGAISAWNTRAERTCECGWRGFVDGWGHEPPNYCPGCGGKVVDE